MRTAGPLTAALLAAGSLLLSPAAAAADTSEMPPGIGIRQLDVEPSAADDGRAARYVTDHVEPGTVVERRIRVSNGTDDTLTLQLYPADATVDEGWHVNDGRGTSELASWISVSPGSITLDPGERSIADVTIAVPDDATGGERYAAVVAEAPAIGDDVRVVPRVGVRVYLSVGGPEEPASDFTIDTLRPGRSPSGEPIVFIDVVNTGGRAIDLQGHLELLDGPGGLRAGPFPVASQTTVGPDRTGEVPVVLAPDLPDGPWRAAVRLRSGEVEREAQAELTFPAAGMGEAVETHPLQDRGLLIPVAAGLLLLALLLLLLVAWRRRRDDEEDHLDGPARTEEHGATLARI